MKNKESENFSSRDGDRQAVRLGDGAIIDAGVTLGYPTSRVDDHALVIGPGAHIRSGSIIYEGTRIGCNFETSHNVVIREQNIIGDNLCIWANSVIDYGCIIGNNVKIHSNVYIAQFTIIEDDVFLAPHVCIANDIHPGCLMSKECMKGPIIKKGAQIGINSSLLPGVTIGEYSVIGSGSVVTIDIPPGVVAYGNPARVMGGIEDMVCTNGLLDKPYSHIIGRLQSANTIR
jgi:acetyltransferase-like isoleucine patch superfamily enzyme